MAKSVFDIPAMDMPHVAAGQPIRAKDFNTVADAVERIYKGVKPPQQLMPLSRPKGGGTINIFTVVSVHEKHVTCKNDADEVVEVARAIDARALSRDEVANTVFVDYTAYNADFTQRVATLSTNPLVTETQIIQPYYRPPFTNEDDTVTPGSKLLASGADTGIAEAPDWIEVGPRRWQRKP